MKLLRRPYGSCVARAFVPAAQMTPSESEYIARSTAMPTPLVTSMSAPNDSFASSGTIAFTSTLNRDVGFTV